MLVLLQIGILGSWHIRSNVLIHKSTYKLADSFIVHRCVYFTITTQEGGIRKQGMGSIQERQLHVLESRHIVGHLGTNSLPGWTTCCKVIFYHPLDEVLAIYRCLIASTILGIQSLDILGTSGRGYAVNHRVGESYVLVHPGSKLLVLSLNKGHESLSGCIAIVLQVITREDGDRTIARSLATTQSFCYISEGCDRLGWVLEIMCHLLIVKHELTCLTRNIISTLSNGERDYLDVF